MHLLRVVHQVPQRVRLRPHVGRWTHEQCERLAAALRRTAGVQSFRLSASGHSLTVHHSAPLQAVLGSLQTAASAEPAATPAPTGATRSKPSRKHRSAARRILLCAVVSLAIALLPEPLAPAMVVLRLLACVVTAAVRYHAEQHAQPCALTRVLDAVAFLIGLARAEKIVRALLKHCSEAVLKRWAESRLREAFTPRSAAH